MQDGDSNVCCLPCCKEEQCYRTWKHLILGKQAWFALHSENFFSCQDFRVSFCFASNILCRKWSGKSTSGKHLQKKCCCEHVQQKMETHCLRTVPHEAQVRISLGSTSHVWHQRPSYFGQSRFCQLQQEKKCTARLVALRDLFDLCECVAQKESVRIAFVLLAWHSCLTWRTNIKPTICNSGDNEVVIVCVFAGRESSAPQCTVWL